MGMPAVFASPTASRSQYISSPKIAQLKFKLAKLIFYIQNKKNTRTKGISDKTEGFNKPVST